MRGRQQKQHSGRRIDEFIHSFKTSSNFKILIFAPLHTNSWCYCGKGLQWEFVTSTDEKWFRVLPFPAEEPTRSFACVFNEREYIGCSSRCAHVMWSRVSVANAVNSSLTFFCLLTLSWESRCYCLNLEYLLFPWTASAESTWRVLSDTKSKVAIVFSCRAEIWTLWLSIQSVDITKEKQSCRQNFPTLRCSTLEHAFLHTQVSSSIVL